MKISRPGRLAAEAAVASSAALLAYRLGRGKRAEMTVSQQANAAVNIPEAKQNETLEEPSSTAEAFVMAAVEVKEEASEYLHDLIEDAKPRLRGWLHLWSVPVILVAGLALLVMAPTQAGRLAAASFTLGTVVTFGMSAIYHRGNGLWSRPLHLLFKKIDHCNIFLLIGATATPFGILLLDGEGRTLFLGLIWILVLLGVAYKLFWINGPRFIGPLLYMVVGWSPLAFVPDFTSGAVGLGHSHAILGFILAGGLFYSIGAVIYALKKPYGGANFGFHEWFHLFTLIACACHYVALSVAAYSLR